MQEPINTETHWPICSASTSHGNTSHEEHEKPVTSRETQIIESKVATSSPRLLQACNDSATVGRFPAFLSALGLLPQWSFQHIQRQQFCTTSAVVTITKSPRAEPAGRSDRVFRDDIAIAATSTPLFQRHYSAFSLAMYDSSMISSSSSRHVQQTVVSVMLLAG